MKIKSLLLAGLAGVALASCGGVKSYKTEVKQATFASDLKKAFDASSLFNVKDPYSFVEDSESTFDMRIAHTKENKTFVEERKIEKTSGKVEYDSVSNVTHSEESTKRELRNNNEVDNYECEREIQTQADSSFYYTIDMDGKLYTKSETKIGAEEIKTHALLFINNPVDAFFDEYFGIAVMEDPGSKFYIDGNVYTCENIIDDTEDGVHDYIQTIYQLVLLEDGFDFYYIVNREKTQLNEKFVVESADKSSFRRKDSVNLKSADLHDYLQVEELPEVKDL